VEAPGTAPGSEWFIATTVYFHSRRTGIPNIGRKAFEKQGFRAGWMRFPLDRFRTVLAMARPSFYASDMSSDSAPAPQQPDLAAAPPGLAALFLAFAGMSLAGFGGVLVFARRAIVEQHRWMTADEFNETFALCHFLPGPNIVNLSMVFGSRLRGIAGGVAAFAGLLLPPTLIMMVLAIAYAHFGDLEVLRRILAGISCAAIGLLIAVVLRMMTPLLKRSAGLRRRCPRCTASQSR